MRINDTPQLRGRKLRINSSTPASATFGASVHPSDIAARRSHRFTFVSYLDLTGIVYNVTTMTRRFLLVAYLHRPVIFYNVPPIPRPFIDLSFYFKKGVTPAPPFIRPTITY